MRNLQEILDEFKEIGKFRWIGLFVVVFDSSGNFFFCKGSANDLGNADLIIQRDQTLLSADFFDEAVQNLNNGKYAHLIIWFL